MGSAVLFDTPRMVTFRGRQRLSAHLLGPGGEDALHAAAKRIGLKREWFQPKSIPHYDLFDGAIERARKAGIPEVTRREAVAAIRGASE